MLATYAGATAATLAVTQVFKGVGFIDKIPTRIFSYVVALVLLIAATAFTAGLTVESAALCIINAVVVSLASNGAFDAVSRTEKYVMVAPLPTIERGALLLLRRNIPLT